MPLLLSKSSALGGEPEAPFEKSLAELGISYIQDAAPELMEHLLGFQLVDRSDDRSKAFGVFGFDLGGQMAYVPIVFISGEVKGTELIYLKDMDLFAPLDESWVKYLLAEFSKNTLGSSAIGSHQQLGISQPDISSLVRPPVMSKMGAWKLASVPEIGWHSSTRGFAPLYGAVTHGKLDDGLDRVVKKTASLSVGGLLNKLLRTSPGWVKLAMDMCEQYPTVGYYWRQFHGSDVFERAIMDQQTNIKNAAAAGPEPAILRRPTYLQGGATGLGSYTADVQFYTSPYSGLSDEKCAEIARQGFIVEDSRPLEKLSAVATVREQRLANPNQTGIYQLLTKPGTMTRALIVIGPKGMDGMDARDTAIIVTLDGDKKYGKSCPSKLWVELPAEGSMDFREDYKKWFDGLSGSDSLETREDYIFVAPNMEGSTAFTVDEKHDDGLYEVWERGCCISSCGYSNYHEKGLRHVRVREGSKFRFWDGMLEVPKGAKAIKLPSESDVVLPGNNIDIQLGIQEKTASLHLRVDGPEVSINRSRPVTKFAALKSLMVEHGLSELDARELMKWAESAGRIGNGSTFRIAYGAIVNSGCDQSHGLLAKRAYGAPGQQDTPYPNQLDGSGISAPPFPEPQMGYGSMGQAGAVEQQPMESYQQVGGVGAAQNDPSVYDPAPEAQTDPMLMQQAQQAGQSGQKELFDTSVLSSLAKGIRPKNRVQEWTRDLIRAMDRLGRILLLFYWHNDEFADRYGKNDLPDLEDAIRNAFEAIGEVALFLKEKDVEPLGGMQMGEADIGELAG